MEEEARPVFISYSRRDGLYLASKLTRDLVARGISPWRDIDQLEGGTVWTSEIERAIDACHTIIAIITPGSYASDICRAEQLRGMRKGKRVVPVLGDSTSDRPLHLEHLQYRDLSVPTVYDTGLAQIIKDLTPRWSGFVPENYKTTYITIPPLPLTYISRPQEIARVREALVNDHVKHGVVLTALSGMGGVGKTVLAQAVATDEVIQAAFPDGIVWTTLGREVGDLSVKIRHVGRGLGDSAEHYTSLEESASRLRGLLALKAALVILDDVWDSRSVDPFLTESRCSRLLITTRDASLASGLGAREVNLDVLTPDESLSLLSQWARPGTELERDMAFDIASECGNLPLSLALCGSMIRDGVALFDIRAALRAADIRGLEGQLANFPYRNVFRCIHASIEHLGATNGDAVTRYLELAAFRPATPIPEAAIQLLWKSTGGLTPTGTRNVLITLERKSFLRLDGSAPDRRVVLHDHQQDYLRIRNADPTLLNKSLLQSYRSTCESEWHSGPNDGYVFESLPFHLRASNHTSELFNLLFDARWLFAKLSACRSVGPLISDYDLLPQQTAGITITRALEEASHIICPHPDQLRSQLLARLPNALAVVGHMADMALPKSLDPTFPSLSTRRRQRIAGALTSGVRTLAAAGDEVVVALDSE